MIEQDPTLAAIASRELRALSSPREGSLQLLPAGTNVQIHGTSELRKTLFQDGLVVRTEVIPGLKKSLNDQGPILIQGDAITIMENPVSTRIGASRVVALRAAPELFSKKTSSVVKQICRACQPGAEVIITVGSGNPGELEGRLNLLSTLYDEFQRVGHRADLTFFVLDPDKNPYDQASFKDSGERQKIITGLSRRAETELLPTMFFTIGQFGTVAGVIVTIS